MKLKQVQHFSDIISSQLLQFIRSCSLCSCQYLRLYSINSTMSGELWFERMWKEVTVVWSELQFLPLPEKVYRKPHSGQLMPQLLNYMNNLLNYCCTDLLGRRHWKVHELNTELLQEVVFTAGLQSFWDVMPYTLVDIFQWSLLHPFSRKESLSNPEDVLILIIVRTWEIVQLSLSWSRNYPRLMELKFDYSIYKSRKSW
jgi:hypothetical protein